MSTETKSDFPWAGQPDEIGCNFALGHLVSNLPIQLSDKDNRIHAETLMAAAGAIAGFAAHIALTSDSKAFAAAVQARALVNVQLADGRELLYGDAINEMLTTADPALAPHRLWNTLAGTALGNGVDEADLPSLAAMFAHVAQSLGSDKEGFPSVEPKHQPHMSAGELLRGVQQLALQCLNGTISEVTKTNGFRAEISSWPAVTSRMAATLLAQTAQVLNPRIGVQIAMESAIYVSKLKPQLHAGQA